MAASSALGFTTTRGAAMLIESTFTGLVATAALPAFAALPLPLATGTFGSATFVSGTFVSGTFVSGTLPALPLPTATLALPVLLALPLPVALALPLPAALATALPLPVAFATALPLPLPLLTVAALLLPLPSCFARSAENPPLALGLDELPVAPNVTGSLLPPFSQPLAAITASTIHRVIIFLYPKKDCERRLREESSLA